jgi:hypothetical protein
VGRFITWLGVHRGKFYAWKACFGKANEHTWRIPRDHWLTPEEKQSILDCHEKHPLDGYRRLTFMMFDQNVVAVSPSTVHRVLSAAGRLDRWTRRPSMKGIGFELRSSRTTPGTSTSPTSTSPALSTTCARSSMAAAVSSSAGASGRL